MKSWIGQSSVLRSHERSMFSHCEHRKAHFSVSRPKLKQTSLLFDRFVASSFDLNLCENHLQAKLIC